MGIFSGQNEMTPEEVLIKTDNYSVDHKIDETVILETYDEYKPIPLQATDKTKK